MKLASLYLRLKLNLTDLTTSLFCVLIAYLLVAEPYAINEDIGRRDTKGQRLSNCKCYFLFRVGVLRVTYRGSQLQK